MAPVAHINGNNLEDLLGQIWRNQSQWSDPDLSVSFPSAVTPYWEDLGLTGSEFTAFSAADRTAFWQAINMWGDVADISLANLGVGDTGDIRAFGVSAPGASWGAKVGSSPGFDVNMDVQVNTSQSDGSPDALPDMFPNSSGFMLLIHEIGHTLGLTHPGSYDAGDGATYDADAEYIEDSKQYSVMSYFDETETGASFTGAIDAPMLHDIYTVQQIYGANYTTRGGNTTYGFNATGLANSWEQAIYDFDTNDRPVFAIWDTGGFDTLDLSGEARAVDIDLRPGEFSSTHGMIDNISIAYNPDPAGHSGLDHFIEKAVGGSADDMIAGNEKANTLEGGGGADTLNGREDDDTIRGDGGTDFLVGNSGIDAIFGGADGDYIIGGNIGETPEGATLLQEFAQSAGYGDFLFGEDGDDSLYGGYGADALLGGLGDDLMEGGWGADFYDGGAGSDTVTYAYATQDWQINLATGTAAISGVGLDSMTRVENLVMGAGDDIVIGSNSANYVQGGNGMDDLGGGGGNDRIEGGNGGDRIEGGSGNDLLLGDAGNDTLSGGTGNDSLEGGAGADTVDYFGATGRVEADLANGTGQVNADLPLAGAPGAGAAEDIDALAGVEYLVGSNSFGDQLRGDDSSNKLYGVGGNDTLEGRGGNDILDGGMGLDTASYASAASGVSVNLGNALPQNTLGAGIDSFISIDNLAGSAHADILVGDGQNNALQGLAGDDWLLGGAGDDGINGGAGDDLLSGGEGDDNISGSSGTDAATYLTAAAGVSVSLALGGYQNTLGAGSDRLIGIENLHGSDFSDTLAGSSSDNTVLGGAGNDTLDGGAGGDAMAGGLGNDIFIVDSELDQVIEAEGAGSGVDRVKTALPAYTLGTNVERLQFTDPGGHAGAGNALDNRLYGNAGDDRFLADAGGGDVFSGGAGSDSMDFRLSAAGAVINFQTGVHGGAALDDIFASMEKFFGSATADDVMRAGAGRANFSGFGGGDTLIGGNNIDTVSGGDGNDSLFGGASVDVLQGGKGDDTMNGGSAADLFLYVETAASGGWGADTITDFLDGVDRIKIDSPGVATSLADFTIAGNGTANVLLTLNALNTSTITLQGAAPITITAADFLFY